MNIDVSIIIVSYNVSKFLRDCIASVKRETLCHYEMIVVDNASEDGSVGMIKKNYPDIKLIQNRRNIGFAAANNIGFREACGRYVFMLNPDTLILDRAVDKLVHFMDEHPNVAACGPKNLNPDMTLQYNCHHFPTLSMALITHLQLHRFFPQKRYFGRGHMTYWTYDRIREVDWITGCSFLFRREIIDAVGNLDEDYFMYSEECDFCYRMKKRNLVTVFFPEASIVHFGGQSGKGQNFPYAVINSSLGHLFLSRYLFFRKNYGRTREVALRIIDLFYYTLVLLKNKMRPKKRNRYRKIAEAIVAIQTALSSFKVKR